MKFPVKFIIGLIILVIGISGSAVCLSPHYSAPEKVVAKYVKAVDNNNIKKMISCTIANDVANALGGDFAEEVVPDSDSDSDALAKSFINSPENAKKIKSVKLLGCTIGENESAFGITGCEVTALIKITYLDDEDEKKTFVTEENITVIKTPRGYKIS